MIYITLGPALRAKIYIFSIQYVYDLKFKMTATNLDRNQHPLTKQDCFA